MENLISAGLIVMLNGYLVIYNICQLVTCGSDHHDQKSEYAYRINDSTLIQNSLCFKSFKILMSYSTVIFKSLVLKKSQSISNGYVRVVFSPTPVKMLHKAPLKVHISS